MSEDSDVLDSPFIPEAQKFNLDAAKKFLSIMRTAGPVLYFATEEFQYPAMTDTIVTHSGLLDKMPQEILNYRVGRFLIIVGPRPAEDHSKLGNFNVYSTKIPGITVYSRKRAAK